MALTKEDWMVIRANPLFADIGEADLRDLIEERSLKRVARNQWVFEQGDKAGAFFLILDGQIKLSRINREGNEAIVHIYKDGDTFAEAAMFMGGAYPVSAQALTASRLLVIDAAVLKRKITTTPEVVFLMLASMSRHLKVLVNQIENMKLLSGDARVARFLLDLCPTRSGPATIVLPYEKALIANHLGMQPETFSRALSRLKDVGVAVSGQSVSIASVERLSNAGGA
ncbi:MAG: Crp/Fnr family transcriptional regulator [Beijerinckiaceae bacterium]